MTLVQLGNGPRIDRYKRNLSEVRAQKAELQSRYEQAMALLNEEERSLIDLIQKSHPVAFDADVSNSNHVVEPEPVEPEPEPEAPKGRLRVDEVTVKESIVVPKAKESVAPKALETKPSEPPKKVKASEPPPVKKSAKDKAKDKAKAREEERRKGKEERDLKLRTPNRLPNLGQAAAPAPKIIETDDAEDDEEESAEAKPTKGKVQLKRRANGPLPPGVTLGRNGRPKLLESLVFLLKPGPLHLNDIMKGMKEWQLEPKSKNPRSYVGFELSKNPKMFRPVGKKRGVWQLVPEFLASVELTGLTSLPESDPEPASTVAETEEENEETMASDVSALDIENIRAMRADEASVKVSDEEARRVVEEMTDTSIQV